MILVLTQCFPPTVGGIESLMAGLAEALVASGRQVQVLADGSDDGADAARPYDIRRFNGVKLTRRMRKGRDATRCGRKSELIIADSWKSLEWLPRMPGVRVHCLAHGMEFPSHPRLDKARRIRRALAKADLVLANSRYTAEQARRYLAAGAGLQVATPPIPPQPAVDPSAATWLAERLGPDAETGPLVATMCRLEPRKGVDRLIAATAALAARYPGLILAVAGGGADRARLEALTAEFGVADRVRFLGRVGDAEKAALLSRADLFAMPARREGDSVEGFGIVYLEAAWYGAPSLAGREGGAGDAVIEGETGVLCDGADQAAVTGALDAMLSNPNELARMRPLAEAHSRRQLWSARVGEFLGQV